MNTPLLRYFLRFIFFLTNYFIFQVVFSLSALAQGLVTPNSHWGASMFPDYEYRQYSAIHFVGFTQYGKEVFQGTNEYTFTPYNDIDETLGFNIISLTRNKQEQTYPVIDRNLKRRTTYMIGLVNDVITEFFQNDLAHWAKIRDEKLRRVPRELDDTLNSTSHGPTKAVPIVGYSQEYFYRIQHERMLGSTRIKSPTPLFAGGGFVVSTINHEVFLHGGLFPLRWQPTYSKSCLLEFCLREANMGGMIRSGILFPSYHFQDLTTSYTNLQATGAVKVSIAGFPMSIDATITSATGFFAETRLEEDISIIDELPDESNDVFEVKRPKRERFVSIRLNIGRFSFEFLNDMIGGKDKGPSFGVSVNFDIRSTNYIQKQIEKNYNYSKDIDVEVNEI